jgi:hypothetical protein
MRRRRKKEKEKKGRDMKGKKLKKMKVTFLCSLHTCVVSVHKNFLSVDWSLEGLRPEYTLALVTLITNVRLKQVWWYRG